MGQCARLKGPQLRHLDPTSLHVSQEKSIKQTKPTFQSSTILVILVILVILNLSRAFRATATTKNLKMPTMYNVSLA